MKCNAVQWLALLLLVAPACERGGTEPLYEDDPFVIERQPERIHHIQIAQPMPPRMAGIDLTGGTALAAPTPLEETLAHLRSLIDPNTPTIDQPTRVRENPAPDDRTPSAAAPEAGDLAEAKRTPTPPRAAAEARAEAQTSPANVHANRYRPIAQTALPLINGERIKGPTRIDLPDDTKAQMELGDIDSTSIKTRICANPDGKPEQVDIIESSGFDRADEHVRETILATWRYTPHEQNNRPVAFCEDIRFVYRL